MPVTWQGWLVTAVVLGLVFATRPIFHKMLPTLLATGVALAIYFVIILLTGSPPGGPGLRMGRRQ